MLGRFKLVILVFAVGIAAFCAGIYYARVLHSLEPLQIPQTRSQCAPEPIYSVMPINTASTPNAAKTKPSSVTELQQYEYAYVTNSNSTTVSRCIIDPASGLLSACLHTGSGLNAPTALEFNPQHTQVYITNMGNNSVSICHINQDNGLLSNCQTNKSNFSSPTSIDVNKYNTYQILPNQQTFISTTEISTPILRKALPTLYPNASLSQLPANSKIVRLPGIY